MEKEFSKKSLLTRYSIKESLGKFSLWNCYVVSDSLSEKEYLLFSLPLPKELNISIEDLRMRSHLFSSLLENACPIIYMQRSDGEITCLTPAFDFVPITKALPSLKSARARKALGTVITDFLILLRRGLFLHNLEPKSVVISEGKVLLLPTSYLLPGEILNTIIDTEGDDRAARSGLIHDLKSMGKVLKSFSPCLEGALSTQTGKLAEELGAVDNQTALKHVAELIDSLEKIAGKEGSGEHCIPIGACIPAVEPKTDIRGLKKKLERSLSGEKNLVILKGKSGEGKSTTLAYIRDTIENDWKLGRGFFVGSSALLDDYNSKDIKGKFSYFTVDDHSYGTILLPYVVDLIFRYLDDINFGVVVVDADLDSTLEVLIEEEAEKRGINITKLELESHDHDDKLRFLNLLGTCSGARKNKGMSPSMVRSRTLEEIRLLTLSGNIQKKKGVKPFDFLEDNENSLLNFLSTIMFEVPLSFLEEIYATKEDGTYDAVHSLLAKGLLKARTDRSHLSNGEIALHFSIASRTITRLIRESMPDRRRRKLHRNIASLLAHMKNIHPSYLFYHLLESDERKEAAKVGHEIIRSFINSKRQTAVKLFIEAFTGEKLDRELEKKARYELLLELGNHFAIVGDIEKAEVLFSRCREEINRDERISEFRELAVEACRKECEILEKRGDFLKAEKLLKKTLNEQGMHLNSKYRAKLYNDLAWVQYRLGRFSDSWEFCLLVHKLLDEKSDPAEIAQAYNLMGALNWNRSKYHDAVLCYKKCLALREGLNDEMGVAASYNNLALVYRSMGKINESLEYLKKSMEIKKKFNNLPGLAAAHLNIALAYLDLEDFKDAEENCTIALDLAEDIGNQQLLAECYGTMGEIYFAKGEHSKAREYYFKDLHICHKTKSLREHAIVFRRLGELSLAEGKTTEAEELLKQARELNKTIGSRLESILLNLLEGRLLIRKNKVEDGKKKLEACSLELSMLGQKSTAAIVAAEIGNLYLDDNNEPLAREYLSRSLSLIEDNEPIPLQVRMLKKRLDELAPPSPTDLYTDKGRFKTLCKVMSLLRTAESKEWFYKTVVETAKKLTGMSRVLLAMEVDRKGGLKVLASSGFTNQKSRLIEKNVARIIHSTKKFGYPFTVSTDELTAVEIDRDFLKAHPVIVCYPLKMQGEFKAFLYLDSTSEKRKFDDEESSFLVTFAHMVAHGIERYLLSEELEDIRKHARVVPVISKRAKEEAKFFELVGSSPAMKHIYELIKGIKDMDATILLTGENGTGKDLVAKTIHYTSKRAGKPFVSLNCSAIPGELLESELFGHEKGAFTGAYRQRIGHFESANGGTILLNEIGDLPLQLQPKLLRLLEEQKFYRLGGTKEISTNVRIIAATNRDLLELVRQERFREDLYYRINIFPIRIPPLRERKEDIEPLCEHFLSMYCSLYNVPRKRIAHETMSFLIDYDWPGNVRELENLINRLIIISKGETILPEDLPDYVVKKYEKVKADTESSLEDAVESILSKVPFSESEPILPKIQGMIIKKMVEKTGDKTKAAAILGISKPTLYAKLKDYDKKS